MNPLNSDILENPQVQKLSSSDFLNRIEAEIFYLLKSYSRRDIDMSISHIYQGLRVGDLQAYLNEGEKKIYFWTSNSSLSFEIDLKHSLLNEIKHKVQKVRSYIVRLWEKE